MRLFESRLNYRVFITVLILFPLLANAQAPFVSTTSKIVGKVNENIAVTGINFGTSLGNIKVQFGGVSVIPTTISDQYLEVKVPIGASNDFVKVLNTSTGLSGSSRQSFLPSFGGQNPFDETRMNGQTDFQSESGLYDIASSDFDGDGKLDIATANNNANQMSIFQNTSPVGSFSFVKTTLNPGVKTLHVATGDLNGDGKPDLISSESNGKQIFIFKNTSSGSISFSMQTISLLADSKANQIRVEDLDLDGKPELIISDQAGARLFIVKNQSTTATISFASPQVFALSGTAGTDGIAIGDLNGDHFPDIVAGEFLTATSNIYIIRNASTPGTINMVQQTPIVLSSTVSNFGIGDLNGDGKDDVAVTMLLASSLLVYRNNTTDDEILLGNEVTFDAGLKPWGIDLGDMDGDGKTDVVVASITQKSVSVLNNQGTGAAFAFTKKQLTTTKINRNVKLVDLDLDGRQDIAFTSIDDINNNIMASRVSIYRNENCVVPVVTPVGPLTICSGFDQKLESSINASSTYEWFKDGVSQGAPSSVSFLNNVAAIGSGLYTVKMVEGTCSKTSNAVQVNVVAQAPLGPANITPVSPVCLNGTLNLSVNNVGATAYQWTGPGGFTASGLSVSRTSFQPAMAGEYNLNVVTGTCITQSLSIVVDIVSVPNVSVQFSGSDIICTGDSKVLSVFPEVTGYTYQWAEETTGNISGGTSATQSVNTTGEYLAKLTSIASPSCAAVETPAKKVRVVNLPVVAFTNPAQICTGQEVPFVDQSTTDDPDDSEIVYGWNFDDGDRETQPETAHAFATARDYDVSLTVGYKDNSCPATLQKTITVTTAPNVQITNPDNFYSVCSGDSLKLQVLGSFTSYLWTGGKTTPFIYAKQAGVYTVAVTSGCTITANKTIGALSSPNVAVNATLESVALGESTVLSATGLVDYHWKPNSSVSDSLSSTTNATPANITNYTVYGTSSNGCYGEASILISVVGASILSQIEPKNYFSPNGDQVNDVWTWLFGDDPIQSPDLIATCEVTIFDERGFKVHEAKPYLNDWDGYSQKGQKLPAGVYFYVIRSSDSNQILTGSINLIR